MLRACHVVPRLTTNCRSQTSYILTFLYFAIVQLYILVLSFYLVAQAFAGGNIDLDFDNGAGGFVRSLFTSTTGLVLIALVSTYGTYIIASILYCDPWHLLTSSWAYFLGMPSTINVLNVYAFCNWHDVSWGTKGSDDTASLPSAKTKKSETQKSFVEEVDKPQADIDIDFELTVRRALSPWQEPMEKKEVQLEDSYKTFRTNLVLLWTLCNGLLALLINNDSVRNLCLTVCLFQLILGHEILLTMCLQTTSTDRTAWYFKVILWATSGLSVFRFLGALWFLGKTGLLCCFSRR